MSRPSGDAPLREHVQWYARRGYRVQYQDEQTAQMVKPRGGFSIVWAVIWFILGIFPLIIYLFYHAAKKDRAVYLSLTAGRVTATEQ